MKLAKSQKIIKLFQSAQKKSSTSIEDLISQQRKNSGRVADLLHARISSKFIKMSRHDQNNRSADLNLKHYRSKSILLKNPLTKSSFSISDTVLGKVNLKQSIKSAKSETQASAKYKKHKLFEKETNIQLNRRNSYKSAFFNSNSLKNEQRNPQTISKSKILPLQQKNMKFKLLFREKQQKFKSSSERKVSKLNTKISELKTHQRYLQSLLPKPKAQMKQHKPVPKGVIIKPEKIVKLIVSLSKIVELYFNMYTHNNIVGGYFRKIEGYNNVVKSVLMIDDQRAKRSLDDEEIKRKFWVFKHEKDRIEYFGEEDLNLYNSLNNYLMKMQSKYSDQLVAFNHNQVEKVRQQKSSLIKIIKKYESKNIRHDKLNEINTFVSQRKRFNYEPFEQNLQGLQDTGLKLNLTERARSIILREKENAMNRHKINDLLR